MKILTSLIILITTRQMLVISAAKKPNSNPTNVHQMSTKKQQNEHKTISRLLDKLLENYDNSLRPNFGGLPAVIEIDLMVRSMGPVSEVEMTYSMDCYFRQTWVDRRLAFEDSSNNISTLALSISMLKKIWKPDTYFFNGKASYLHTITTPNKFVRLYQDGRVLYSSRLTIKAACPMSLNNFPMDVQHCPLRLGSFGYTTSDVIYRWNDRAVAISEDLRMSQFDLIDVPSSNESYKIEKESEGKIYVSQEFSVLKVQFKLQRHMGNFLIQVYGPCVLLVVLSWVSFWLNREATADRVSLGITTVLTMTFLGLEARTDLPKVSYPTALDFFVFLSFAFIFATILQFAFVHYFTKYGSGECYYDFCDSDNSDSEDENGERRKIMSNTSSLTQIDSADLYGVIPLSRLEIKITEERSPSRAFRRIRDFIFKYFLCFIVKDFNSSYGDDDDDEDSHHGVDVTFSQCDPSSSGASTTTQNTPQGRKSSRSSIGNVARARKNLRRNFNSVSKIDKFSRVAFPFLFFLINLIYWIFYLTRSQRK